MAAAETSPVVDVSGVVPILLTPFRPDGTIDRQDLDRELDFLAGTGVHMIGVGYGSEVHRLDPQEATDLVAYISRRTRGRLGVIGNADVPSTRAGVGAVRRMRDAGAAAALVRPSGLAGVPQQAVFDALATVATEGGLPLVVQDAPQHTGLELWPRTIARLLTDVDGIVAAKIEPPAPAPKISEVVEALDGAPGTIIGGAGGQDFVHELQRGSAGTMPGPAVVEVFLAVYRLHRQGRVAAAHGLLGRLMPLIVQAARTMDTFLYQQKYLLQVRGVLTSCALRTPHPPLDPRLTAEIEDLLGLLDLDDVLATARAMPDVAAATRAPDEGVGLVDRPENDV